MLLSLARGRGWVRGLRQLVQPPHLASPPSGGEEHESGGEEHERGEEEEQPIVSTGLFAGSAGGACTSARRRPAPRPARSARPRRRGVARGGRGSAAGRT